MIVALYRALHAVALTVVCVTAARAQLSETLTSEGFMDQVKKYHPVARQAGITVERAAAALTAAKGNFDPIAEMSFDNKEFAGTEYYRYLNGEIKIPTITGVTIKSGFENSTGRYINPELTSGVASYIGLEVPLLKGLLIDKQRATLKQARFYATQSLQERANTLNDLLYDANIAYWQWAGAYQLYNLYSRYMAVAKRRMDLVRLAYHSGDRSIRDTIEAYSQLQNVSLLQYDAAVRLNAGRYDLSAFLWDEQSRPYVVAETYVPDTAAFAGLRTMPPADSLEAAVLRDHPALQVYQSKGQMLTVDRQLKLQNLLPTFNVKANLLSKNYYDKLSLSGAYLNNNYKFGFTIKTPLFLRQARGEYREANLKIKENNTLLSLKTWELTSKLRKYYNEALLYTQQLANAAGIKASYAALLKIEELKFAQGESSLFMVNSRENKLLELEQKLIELKAKYLKSFAAIEWSAGLYSRL